ncbi:response regulator [Kineococcus esterisolvens]|uniref:response regulator n=1 Tax=unclassified Kineococcus TaxID=2621656 RepID=UPI003D7D51B9
MIRVLIVDDHPIVRDGLRGVISASSDLEVVGEAADGPSAVTRSLALAPDVVLMDLRMPGGDGVAAIEALTCSASASRVLVLTTYDSDDDILRAVEAGATGYLLKDCTADDLLRGIRAAARGESVLAPAVASRLLTRVRAPAAPDRLLSPRELQVLQLIARGTSNRDCARRMFLSEATVKTHLQHIYEKFGVSDRAAAVATGYERGLLGP